MMNNWYQDMPPAGKRLVRILAITLMAGLAAGFFAIAYSYAVSGWVSATTLIPSRQISASGEGKAHVQPDTAFFTASVVTSAKRLTDAQQQNSQRSSAITEFLAGKGVAKKDVKTTAYNISPQYQYYQTIPCTPERCQPQKPPEIVSYEVRHTLEITVRDLAKTDSLLQGVTDAGANEIGSISFRVDDKTRELARAQAREQAIAAARIKAMMIASQLGVRLGRTIAFYEGGDNVPPILPLGAGGAGPSKIAYEAAPSVQPGEQDIVSTVSITYEFR